MNLKELIGKLPESDRQEAEKAIQEAITASNPVAAITTREQAFEYIGKNPAFKAALDEEIRSKVANHDELFKKEKLPGLVEARIKELHPPTDPRDVKLAEFEAKLAERDKRELQANQRAVALKIAASEGIPVEGIERFIADNDDATIAQVKAQAKILKDFRDAAVDETKKGIYGNVGKPQGGSAKPGQELKTQAEIGGMPPKERADFFAKGGAASD